MRKSIFILLLLIVTAKAFAQNNPRPSKSRFFNSTSSTFQIKPGDILVYEVNDSGDVYNFVATVNKYGDAINFDYKLDKKSIKGSVTIAASAVKSATSYDNDFSNINKNLQDKTTVWLSKVNYQALASGDKETTMNMGDGAETFTRERTSTLKINYKGRERIITVYDIANQNAAAKKTLVVLNDPNNPLIISMNLGWTVTLKEVR